ncbi:hypothetical protein HPP92_009624 [Vanilla planifolia]|uniref:Uncharacterized protein n=1 Tax=Vanilla planifolia TaxID=51239 RepID=A0A835V6H4_VANPL|nr:hypothetical protein HPP92_009624 [Vanilla planifolia]
MGRRGSRKGMKVWLRAAIIARRNTVEEQQEMVEEALKKAFSSSFVVFGKSSIIFWVKEAQFQEKGKKCGLYSQMQVSGGHKLCWNVHKSLQAAFRSSLENLLGCQLTWFQLEWLRAIPLSHGNPALFSASWANSQISREELRDHLRQHPPADDPALKQPCYQRSCMAKQAHGVDCSR